MKSATRIHRIVCLGVGLVLLCAAGHSSGQIIINEINYHPYEPWPTNQPARTVNDTEFIELYNAGPYSCLCPFGEDPGHTGEYNTYHIVMTEINRTGPDGLEVRWNWLDDLLDCTFIKDNGDIFYNCGVRYRGKEIKRHASLQLPD